MTEWDRFSDEELLAMCIWGEARGEPIEAQIGVGCVVRNRMRDPGKDWWGDTWLEVLLKPKQFSCFNEGDPNREKMLAVHISDSLYAQARWIAIGIMNGEILDNTGGSTHYHSFGVWPNWADGRTEVCQLGQLLFFKIGPGGDFPT